MVVARMPNAGATGRVSLARRPASVPDLVIDASPGVAARPSQESGFAIQRSAFVSNFTGSAMQICVGLAGQLRYSILLIDTIRM